MHSSQIEESSFNRSIFIELDLAAAPPASLPALARKPPLLARTDCDLDHK
jgi:hypothetical protein